MAGPPKEPVALKILKGNPGKQKLNKNEPKGPLGEPEKPKWLDPVASEEWDRAVSVLLPLGVLSTSDGAALASYCLSYSMLQACSKVLENGDMTQFNERSQMDIIRPEAVHAIKCLTVIRNFCQEFGMTPSARGKMVVPEGLPGHDPLEEMLGPI